LQLNEKSRVKVKANEKLIGQLENKDKNPYVRDREHMYKIINKSLNWYKAITRNGKM